MMRVAIPSVLSLALGLQVALASLFLSLLKVQFLETGTHRRTVEPVVSPSAAEPIGWRDGQPQLIAAGIERRLRR